MCHLNPLPEALGEALRLGRRTLFRTLACSHRLQRELHLVVPRVQPLVLVLVLIPLVSFHCHQSPHCVEQPRPCLENQALVCPESFETLFPLLRAPLLEAQH